MAPSEMQKAPADEARARAKESQSDRGAARHSTPHRLPQLQCECCSKSFNKRAGRRRRFCSDACRMASARAKEALNGSEVQSTLAFGNAPNRPYDSKRYKAISRDPYPSRFSVPLDLLGRGHRWPDAPKLDSKTRDKILWREIGRAP